MIAFCQRCKKRLDVESSPEFEDIGLKRLDRDESYKIKHTGKWWCEFCFWRKMEQMGVATKEEDY